MCSEVLVASSGSADVGGGAACSEVLVASAGSADVDGDSASPGAVPLHCVVDGAVAEALFCAFVVAMFSVKDVDACGVGDVSTVGLTGAGEGAVARFGGEARVAAEVRQAWVLVAAGLEQVFAGRLSGGYAEFPRGFSFHGVTEVIRVIAFGGARLDADLFVLFVGDAGEAVRALVVAAGANASEDIADAGAGELGAAALRVDRLLIATAQTFIGAHTAFVFAFV